MEGDHGNGDTFREGESLCLPALSVHATSYYFWVGKQVMKQSVFACEKQAW